MVAGDTAAGDTASDKVEPEQPGFLETLGRKVFQ
jgi:hypothetical protein